MLTPTLRRSEGWLLYEALVSENDPAPATAFDPETLLAWSAELPGGCKFARVPQRAGLRVLAELPALAESPERLAPIEAGFAAAARRLGFDAGANEDDPLGGGASPDLASLCREAGWLFEARSDGTLAVDLGVPGAYLPALIEVRTGGVSVEAEIVRLPESGRPCRAALAALLLRANGAFRMARAVSRARGNGHAPEAEGWALLEVLLPLTASAAELGEAIASITVSARRSALEARVVASDEGVARALLEQSGKGP